MFGVEGGYHNDTNYCRIDRPGCGGGGFVQMYWTQWSEGPCLGGKGGTAMMQIIQGLISNICKFLSRLVTEMKLRIPTGMAE